MKNTRHVLFVVITMVVVIGAMALAFLKWGKPQEMLDALKSARWGWAPLAVVMGLLVYPVKALRWGIILGPGQPARYRTMLSAIMIGFMANCIVSRLGELIRAAVMAIKGEMRTSTALASIALERIFDMCTVALFLVIALQWLGTPTESTTEATYWLKKLSNAKYPLGVGLALGILFLVFLRLYPQRMTALVMQCARVLPGRLRAKVETFLATFLAGLDTLRSVRQVLAILALSLIHWSLQVGFFLFSAWCLPDLNMAVPGALLVFAATAFGVAALPIPGYIGIYQAAIMGAGYLMGMPTSRVAAAWTSYSWLSWALNIPVVVLVGFIFLWMENLSFSRIRQETTAKAEDAAADRGR